MMHQYVKTYNNIRVRPLEEKDIESLRIWRNEQNSSGFLRNIPFITPEQQKAWFQTCCNDTRELYFAIDEIQKLHGLVGSAALSHLTDTEAEFGRFLIGNPDAAGLHAGTNALEAIKSIAKNTLGLSRLYAYTYEDNQTAKTVFSHAGFTLEDTFRENGRTNCLYSIRL